MPSASLRMTSAFDVLRITDWSLPVTSDGGESGDAFLPAVFSPQRTPERHFVGDPVFTPANAKTAFAGDPVFTPANAKTAFAGDPVEESGMRDFGERNITAAVAEAFQGTPDPRLKQVMSALVRHLHEFVREVDLTQEEWSFAIDYLTRTGQACSEKRQEFVLLSDTLGISMLVDAINHRMPIGATETTVLGPFYVQNPPERPLGFDLGHGLEGEPLYVEGIVSSAAGAPLPNAMVDTWQSDGEGYYDVQHSGSDLRLRGRFRTDPQGRFHFWSIMPTSYPIPQDGTAGEMLRATARHPYRPAHVHFLIAAEGHETLITHIFADGDPYLDSDAVFAVKDSLIREFTREPAGVAPDGTSRNRPWRKLTYNFGLRPLAISRAA